MFDFLNIVVNQSKLTFIMTDILMKYKHQLF